MSKVEGKKSKPQTRNEYLVQVTIVEARNLKGSEGTGSCDPFVRITVSGQPPQVTTTKKQASNCVFNQSFTFTNIMLNQVELESFEIKIEVLDLQQFSQNRLVGSYSIGLSTLFRNPGHEIYNQWLRMTTVDEGLEPQGFILCSAYIISASDRPPVHDLNENQVEEEPDEFGGKPDDQLTGEELVRRRAKKQMIAIVQKPELYGKPYQLMVNIYKAEDLPALSFNKCDSFISVRAGGITQITSVMKNMQKPQYATRLMFPLYFPVFNDKIVIRVWDKRVCMTDTFIAMIPEIPTETDFFNANFLQSRGGVMPYRWFCLYGIPMDERPSNFEESFLGYKKKLIGTEYMGRVCLSLNLTPSEKPEKLVKPLNTFKEPPVQNYLCRVDFYEVQDAKDCGTNVTLQVRVGPLLIKSPPAEIKGSRKKKNLQAKETDNKEGDNGALSYDWTDKQIIEVQDLKGELPQDGSQIPDLILSLYDQQNKRQAYLRIPYGHQDLANPKPTWYTLNCVKNKDSGLEGKGEVAFCFVLVNLMIRPESVIAQIPRIAVKRNTKEKYNLHAFIYAGYDLCPDRYSEEVEVQFFIKIPQFKTISLENTIAGKNPIWNHRFFANGYLDGNLEFASNIMVNFINLKKQPGYFSDNLVGDICIHSFDCGIDSTEKDFKLEDFQPTYKFYHITNRNGSPAGRILAAFHLEKLKKNVKEKDQSLSKDIIKADQYTQMQIKFPIFGVRKAPSRFKDPVIYVRVPLPPQYPESPKKTVIDENNDIDQEKKKPKVSDFFSANYRSVRITSTKDNDKNGDGESDGWFSKGIQDPNFLYLLVMDIWVPDNLKFWPQIEVELRESGNSGERFIAILSLIELAKNVDVLEKSEAIRFFNEGREPIEEDIDAQIYGNVDEKKQSSENKGETNGEEAEGQDHEEKQKEQEDKKQEEELKKRKEIEIKLQTNPGQKLKDNIVRSKLMSKNVLNVLVDEVIEISLSMEDEKTIMIDKKWRSDTLTALLKQTKTLLKFDEIKTIVRKEMAKSSKVDEDEFFGISKDDDEDGGGIVDYGRKTLKGPYEDEIRKQIPFKRFPLFRLSTTKYGIIGNPTDAFIKGDIVLIVKPLIDILGVKLSGTSKGSKVSKGSKGSKKSSQISSGSKKSKKSKALSQKNNRVIDSFKFNLFSQAFLSFFLQAFHVKVRIYLLRGLNLAAQSQNIDTHHMLAGMNAFCEANPFAEIIVGEKDGKKTDLIKYVNDSEKASKNTLSPEFFTMYELDAELPQDWKMTINIMDKGLFNNLIGQVTIDLEDRFVGETTLKERIAYMVFKQIFTDELAGLKFVYDPVAEKLKGELQSKLTDLTQRIDTFDKDRYCIPVEYCELKKQGAQQTSQGTIEMWVEVLPIDISREIPPSPISRPDPQEYEVRFIVLETMGIPRNPNKNNIVDIFVKASMDATATGTDKEEEKETDTHNGSQDGAGVFNWRMKFPFIYPCPFPRLKISVYDMNAFSSDENIGEAIVSLKRVTNRLSTDGKYDMPPTMVKISHPNFPDQDRGEVLVQINIVTKQVADGNPVGDAQEEPNLDPFLEKPTVGRGLADFFKGSGGGGKFWLYVKIGAGVIVLLLVIMVLFVKPGILVN